MIGEIFNDILNTLDNILSIKELPNFGVMPPPLIPLSQFRNGMSAIRAASKVYEKKKELKIPTGPLPDGSENNDDILWYTAIQAIMDEITNEAKISTSITPGTQIIGTGIGNLGIPIVIYGATTTFGIGGTIIE